MIGGGFIEDMIRRTKYNKGLLRGKALFKKNQPKYLYKDRKVKSPELEKHPESQEKLFKSMWKRRRWESVSLFMSSIVMGCLTIIILIIISVIVYSSIIN